MALLLGTALLAGCSSGSKVPEPMALDSFTALVPARQVWTAQVGTTHAQLVPVARGERVFVASAAGTLAALDGRTGGEVWRVNIASPLSAGVGSDGTTAAVVTSNNQLVAVANGAEVWRTQLPARVFTPPLVAGQRVFVLAGDRSVSAFDARTGTRLWSQAPRGTDPLVLQQAGVLLPVGDVLYAGIGGRLTAYNPNNGAVRSESALATPRGVNEIERLVDLVGPAGRVDTVVCARAYQATVGCVNTAGPSVLWTRPSVGSVGVDADADFVFTTEGNGRVQALRRSNGEPAWSHDRLLHRGLTAPLAAGRSIVVGDAQGFVHLLSRLDGGLLNRLPTDGSPILATPVLAGNTLVAVTRNGNVYGWRPE
ncbi:MAG: outer membrane protein assembly factor BamB [Serpentinimonas sp.]|nr:outer membrane protein assembly factor BamB [Serpentinimonas sp.]